MMTGRREERGKIKCLIEVYGESAVHVTFFVKPKPEEEDNKMIATFLV